MCVLMSDGEMGSGMHLSACTCRIPKMLARDQFPYLLHTCVLIQCLKFGLKTNLIVVEFRLTSRVLHTK